MDPGDSDEGAEALDLGFGLTFRDLYEREGLARVDAAFLAFLANADSVLSSRLSRPGNGLRATEQRMLHSLWSLPRTSKASLRNCSK